MDSGASHNITYDLGNLFIHSEYDGTDAVVIGDGSGLPVTHIGSLVFHSSAKNFSLSDTLCVPQIHKNLVCVHQFTKSNNVLIEFHPNYFFVKDRTTGATLLQGRCEHGVYPLPTFIPSASPSIIANIGERTTSLIWHHRLGHPSQRLVTKIISQHFLPLTTCGSLPTCHPCHINKSHQLPFHSSTIHTIAPLQYVFSDVWGPAQELPYDGYKYYVVFIDHFTRYCWFFPMHNKFDVRTIFPQLHVFLEKQFGHSLKNLYNDNGGEYLGLRSYLQKCGISHLTTSPHTPQHNGIFERKHRHIVEIGKTLLTQANMPPK